VYRLPTEAEWEYACRAGTKTPYNHGTTLDRTRANNASQMGRTCKVGSYKPNKFGLYDMHGNVAEWCSDWHTNDYYSKSPSKDPQGPATGSQRVFRGGSWRCSNSRCRSAFRYYYTTRDHDIGIGFRVVMTASR
jgi:formylglycine-generating enzyme required for sulfatase activity